MDRGEGGGKQLWIGGRGGELGTVQTYFFFLLISCFFLLWHCVLLALKMSGKILILTIKPDKNSINSTRTQMLSSQICCFHNTKDQIDSFVEKMRKTSHHWSVYLSIPSHMTTAVVESQSQSSLQQTKDNRVQKLGKILFFHEYPSCTHWGQPVVQKSDLTTLKIARIPSKGVFSLVNYCDCDSVADLRAQNVLNFMQFFWGNLAKSYVANPPLGGLAPLLRGILDPPLR